MKYKKIWIVLCLIICLFSIASVAASDADGAAIQTGNDTMDDAVAFDDATSQENVYAIASQEENGQDTLDLSDEDELSVKAHPFDELQSLIDNAQENDELNLTMDYSLAYGGHTLIISKNMTINGNGHTIDGGNLARILNISVNNALVQFKNIKFKNGGMDNILVGLWTNRGGAIVNDHAGTNIIITNCDFRHNGVMNYGGAIYTEGSLHITDTKFHKNIATFGNGGAIFCNGELFLNNTEFIGNEVDENFNPIYTTFMKNQIWNILTDAYYFNGENLIKSDVLIKIIEKLTSIYQNPVTDKGLTMTGGAIYCKKDCTVHNSLFQGNIVGVDNEQIATSGGAIHCQGNIVINTTTFEENKANDWGGGAIFAEKDCTVYNSTFEDNTANKGGAIYCWGATRAYDSEFSHNRHDEGTTWMEGCDIIGKLLSLVDEFHILDVLSIPFPTFTLFSSDGGAIWSQGECYIESCQFDGNQVCEQGGAIYAKSSLTITGEDNLLHNNQVFGKRISSYEKDGGAIYCKGLLNISNIYSYNNMAFMKGGVIYCESEAHIYNSRLDKNDAKTSGGAIYTKAVLSVTNCSFTGNTASLVKSGGAIYAENDLSIVESTFNDNTAYEDGGAIYCEGKSTISYTEFSNNVATGEKSGYRSFGGAIYSDKLLIATNCSFNGNTAKKYGSRGGAICANNGLILADSNFTGNTAQKAGAVYASTINHLSNSVFSKNQATSGEGGAVFINDECNPEFNSCKFEENSCTDKGGAIYVGTIYFHIKTYSCSFTNNHAGDIGGAIYAGGGITKSDMGIKDSTFTGNSAKSGGAVHISKVTEITGSSFFNNTATEKNGGAVYINFPCDPVVSSCTFKGNTAHYEGGGICVGSKYCNLKISDSTFDDNHVKGYGGAVYLDCDDVVFSTTEITNSRFTSNSAQQGGAVFTGGIKGALSNSVFIGNKANWGEGDKDGNGGAINIFNRGPIEIVSCRFEQNYAYNVGGAVYIDSNYKTTHLKVSYCTFVDNQADSKKYSSKHYYCGPGHSIFNCGWYDLIDMCWFGKNDPDFKWDHYFHRQFVEKRTGRDDLDHTPTNILKISMNINETEIYKNNSYKVTVHFENGLSKDLLHSRGTFDGDGNFSNINADRNDMTTEVILTIDKPTLYGHLDHQTVSLNLNAKDKEPSKVIIISCDDVNYPNPVNVTYEISGMADSASYVIKNDLGEIVKEGKIASPNNLLVENLTPGAYSITLNNPESRTHLASCNNTTFNVNKGNIDLRIVVLNETYPEDVECDIYASADGEYQLSIAGCSTTVVVKDHVAHFHRGTLDANTYEAIISFEGNDFYYPASNRTTFTVSPEGTNFEIEINPSEVIYGEDATVIHSITDGATGIIKYYLHNGTFLGESSVDDNFTLPVLNVGSYLVIANYTGDHNHLTASDTAHVTVNKGKPAFKLETALVSYGDNGTAIPILPDVATGSIKYYLENGTFLGELSVNENLTMPAWNVGTYLILAQYSGDKNFFNATANATLIVNKGKTEITAFPVIATYKDNDYLLITLRNHNGNPIVGFNVTVMFNGAGNYTTNENGQINISTSNLGAGTYNVTFNFDGSENYWNCSNATQVFINTRPSIMTVAPFTTTYQVHKYLIVNLKDDLGNPITNTNTFLTVNGITYHAKTDSKGDARLIIRLDPKNYIGTLTFDNNNYTLSLGFVKITVLKATPKITAKNKKFKASKKVKKYTVILKDNIGKAMSKVKVTLKIKGKTYKATTNSKGKATFKIKKLTKNGKYKATVTFNGNFRFNKVTKKVKITCTK